MATCTPKEKDCKTFLCTKKKKESNKKNGPMVAKSLKGLLLYMAHEEHDEKWVRVIELVPELQLLMLWQLDRHRMDAGKITMSRRKSGGSGGGGGGGGGSGGGGWLLTSRSGRERKKVKTFAEEDSLDFHIKEKEREKLRVANKKKKKEKERLEREEEKKEKKIARELQTRMKHERKMKARKIRAMRKTARRRATWGGSSDEDPFEEEEREDDEDENEEVVGGGRGGEGVGQGVGEGEEAGDATERMLREVRRHPKVVECVTFAWCAAKALNLKEDDIPLEKFEEGIVGPEKKSEGSSVLSLLMSRLVVHQDKEEGAEGAEGGGEGEGGEGGEGGREVGEKVGKEAERRRRRQPAERKRKRRDGEEDDGSDSDWEPSSGGSGRGGCRGGGSSRTSSSSSASTSASTSTTSRVGLPYKWWGPRLINMVGMWYKKYDAARRAEAVAKEVENDSAAAAAAAVAAYRQAQALQAIAMRGSSRPSSGGGGKKAQRCRQCAGCLREDCGSCNHCQDMKKYGGPGNLRQACRLRQCMSMNYTGEMSGMFFYFFYFIFFLPPVVEVILFESLT